MTMESILIISAIGVTWNTVLQTWWFFWSRKVYERKHLTDEQEIDISDRIREFYQEKEDFEYRQRGWRDFGSQNHLRHRGDDFFTHQEPKRGANGKYNPDEIAGSLDDFFGDNSDK